MKHSFIMIVLCAMTGFLSCKEKESPREVSINIISPLPGSEYDKDDTVWLRAEISSNLELEQVRVGVNKVSNDSVAYASLAKTSEKSMTLTTYFINQFNPHADLEMSVQTMDKNGSETGKKQVRFHCHAH
jgi:hypothetical protein